MEAQHVPQKRADEALPVCRGVVGPALGPLPNAAEAGLRRVDGAIGTANGPAPTPTENAAQVVVGKKAPNVAQVPEVHRISPSGTRKRAPRGRGGRGSSTCSNAAISPERWSR